MFAHNGAHTVETILPTKRVILSDLSEIGLESNCTDDGFGKIIEARKGNETLAIFYGESVDFRTGSLTYDVAELWCGEELGYQNVSWNDALIALMLDCTNN